MVTNVSLRGSLTPVALACAALVLGANLACESAEGPCVCTREFRFFTISVLDEAGEPVSDLAITRTNQRTGTTLEPQTLALTTPGTYVVADDSMLDEFSSDGDVVRVTGTNGTASFEASFVFATPEPCRCHVQKISGPETISTGQASGQSATLVP